MRYQIIKQPNNLYALFSSFVDDFILIDAKPKDIVNELLSLQKKEIEKNVERVIESLENGEKPYFQFTLSFDDAVQIVKGRHGNDAESLRMLSGNDYE